MITEIRPGAPGSIFFASLLVMGATQTTLAAATAIDLETMPRMEMGEGDGEVKPAFLQPLEGVVKDDRAVYFAANGTVAGESSSSGDRDAHRDYKHTRIVGGSKVRRIDDYSFAAAFVDSVGLYCGASLIARDAVLTAAHCGLGSLADVFVGSYDLMSEDGEVIPMKRQVQHPQYDEETTDYDFMVTFLDRATTRDVDLVVLNNDASYPDVGDIATVVGWGDTVASEEVTRLSNVLMEVDVKVISNNKCKTSGSDKMNYRGHITKNMLCAEADLKDSCQGDSGGPLLLPKGRGVVQIGIVSWGVGCANNDFPGVYARVNRAYDWIEEEVCKGSRYASEAGFDCGGEGASVEPPAGPRLRPSTGRSLAPTQTFMWLIAILSCRLLNK